MNSLDSNLIQISTLIQFNASPIFPPFQVEACLDANEEECFCYDSFLNLINEQIKKNETYVLALLKDVNSSHTFCFDAKELSKWTKTNWTNPISRNKISQIFHFSISGYPKDGASFNYLGSLGEDKIFIPSDSIYLTLPSKNKIFVKIEGDYNISSFKPFIRADLFVDTNEFVCELPLSNTKVSFVKLLADQVKNKLPYIFAVVIDEGTSISCYFDGFGFQKYAEENLNLINPITGKKIANFFYCMIPPNSTKNKNISFTYVGGLEGERDKKIIDTTFKALSGNVSSQYLLGVYYSLGEGVEQNFDEAFKWFKIAADNNDPDALFEMGVCYNEGKGVKKDMKKAVALWKKTTSGKDPSEAYYHLGLNYLEGKGIQKDVSIAAMYFRCADLWDHPNAKTRFDEWKLYAKDKEKGQCYCLLGMAYMNLKNKDLESTINHLIYASDKGNADALYLLLRLYYHNDQQKKALELLHTGKVNPNFEDMLKYWKFVGCSIYSNEPKGFEKTLALFQLELGIICFDHMNLNPSVINPIKWLKLSGTLGNANAQYLLGLCYHTGKGTKIDSKEAVKWLKLSAKQDNQTAKTLLSEIHSTK